MSERFAAEQRVLQSALRVISGSFSDYPGPDDAAEAEYASEMLAIAARDLTDATNALPTSEQPVGWGSVSARP